MAASNLFDLSPLLWQNAARNINNWSVYLIRLLLWTVKNLEENERRDSVALYVCRYLANKVTRASVYESGTRFTFGCKCLISLNWELVSCEIRFQFQNKSELKMRKMERKEFYVLKSHVYEMSMHHCLAQPNQAKPIAWHDFTTIYVFETYLPFENVSLLNPQQVAYTTGVTV